MVDARSTRAGTRVPATGHVSHGCRRVSSGGAQRGPGLASRQRQHASGTRRQKCQALNEGRDSRPGNGSGRSMVMVVPSTDAQRGPGLASRQRMTAGSPRPWRPRSAQRGPGLASRQRVATPAAAAGVAAFPLNEGRDSRPGNGELGPRPGQRRRRRSTRAGTRVPATVFEIASFSVAVATAQRGPGLASRQRSAPRTSSRRWW